MEHAKHKGVKQEDGQIETPNFPHQMYGAPNFPTPCTTVSEQSA